MTEEMPQVDVDSYKFPDKYFDKLREYDGQHEDMVYERLDADGQGY
mgnify:CR=1 FL=1